MVKNALSYTSSSSPPPAVTACTGVTKFTFTFYLSLQARSYKEHTYCFAKLHVTISSPVL